MRILVVNPNTTSAMTEKIGQVARAAAAGGTEIIAVNPPDGPVSIEGYYDDAFSVPGLLAEIAKGEALGVSAHVIACFDDTGSKPREAWRRCPSSVLARRRFIWPRCWAIVSPSSRRFRARSRRLKPTF